MFTRNRYIIKHQKAFEYGLLHFKQNKSAAQGYIASIGLADNNGKKCIFAPATKLVAELNYKNEHAISYRIGHRVHHCQNSTFRRAAAGNLQRLQTPQCPHKRNHHRIFGRHTQPIRQHCSPHSRYRFGRHGRSRKNRIALCARSHRCQ